MTNEITQKYLQEYFTDHDTLILYKPDGTPVTFRKQSEYVLRGGGSTVRFKTYDDLMAFYNKQHLCLKPVIAIC